MSDSVLKTLLLLGTILFSLSPCSYSQNDDQTTQQSTQDQQSGLQKSLEDAIPESDQRQEQGLENPRIVAAENLKELPLVKVVDSAQASLGKLQQLEHDLNIDKVSSGVIKGSDKLMDLSRAPLTYVQNHVPFLTKRHIIFFGRLELDYANYSSGVLTDESGFDVRRFRLGLAGQVKFWPAWNYKFEMDLTDKANTLSDAYISWHSSKWGTIRIGNQKIAHSMSGSTSSISQSFMERPLPTLALTLEHRLGVGYDFNRKHWGGNITVFGKDPNDDVGSHGFSTRMYFNPSQSATHVIHVGGSVLRLYSDDDAQLWARPESHKTDTRLVDTGVNPNIDNSSSFGIELAASKDQLTFRSEFFGTFWNRSDSADNQFKSWYAEASWFLTGEKSHYREGKFIRPNILNESGAWELAARISAIDLHDNDVEGGKEQNITVGLNWYSQIHWRFMSNLIKVHATDGPYGDQNPWIVQFRAQYYF
ncbi:MAG: porin [Pseudomonadales bacterium]